MHLIILMPFSDIFIQPYFNFACLVIRPSSSKAEKIRSIYYEAEYHGQQQDCYRYYEQCGISILDLISDIISVELHKMTG